jgi:hypothetical protein
METESSLPDSQEPATCPYHKPYQSSSFLPIQFPENSFQYYIPIHAYVFQMVSFH